MLKSLRWRLQLWHAGMLAFAISLFAFAFYQQLRRSTLSEIDLGLLSSARVIDSTLRALPRGAVLTRIDSLPLDFNIRPLRNPRNDSDAPSEGSPVAGPPRDPSSDPLREPPAESAAMPQAGPGWGPAWGPGRGPGPPQRPATDRGPMDRGPMERGPPDRGPMNRGGAVERGQRPLAEADDRDLGPQPDPPYVAVFSASGEVLRQERTRDSIEWSATRRPVEYRYVNSRREVLLRGPYGLLIVVGRDIQPQLSRLNEILVQLVLSGCAVLTLGLLGGWWLAGKAIQPITKISQTAANVSAANLSTRIDSSSMDRELQSLTETLNSMLARLDRSFQQQVQFTADASHELRTPIAVLLSHCELALNRPRAEEEYRQTLATCQKAAHRMSGLVEGLLTLARVDAGRLDLRLSSTDLAQLAAETRDMFQPFANEQQVEIQLRGSPAPCRVDSNRLAQVVSNLLQNAIQYNRPGGQVTLETELTDGVARLRVRDTGIGIPAAALPHLFDRFYRVDEARARSTGGNGIGLAICQSIIEAHGGKITVESKLGSGSVLEIQLPASSTALIGQ